MDGYLLTHERPKSFFPEFTRKHDAPEQTHYCPGCGHGTLHKLIALAIDQLGIQDRTIFVSPVGCSVFAYHYFDTGHIQGPHGRAPAVATAAKRARPDSITLVYQGDGDLAAIGTAEIIHAANRGESLTVFFVNNAIYGMTGGQMAPTTPLATKSTTTPFGRQPSNEGYPLRMSELLATLEAPVYIERVALGNNKQIMGAARAVKKAIDNQVHHRGFSFIEILSPCPTVWKMSPVDAQKRVREDLTKIFPLGVFRDHTQQPVPAAEPRVEPSLAEIPRILGIGATNGAATEAVPANVDYRIRISGFGGQGVLLLGELLAEAGMDAGFAVSWLPSYGPEMRSGTSNCHVRLASTPIDSPVVSQPNVLMALNEPSLRRFLPSITAGGLVFYNGHELPEDCRRADVEFVVQPFFEIADELGDTRTGNMVLLGAFLERAGVLPVARVEQTLRRIVKSEHLLELDGKAIACGQQRVRQGVTYDHA